MRTKARRVRAAVIALGIGPCGAAACADEPSPFDDVDVMPGDAVAVGHAGGVVMKVSSSYPTVVGTDTGPVSTTELRSDGMLSTFSLPWGEQRALLNDLALDLQFGPPVVAGEYVVLNGFDSPSRVGISDGSQLQQALPSALRARSLKFADGDTIYALAADCPGASRDSDCSPELWRIDGNGAASKVRIENPPEREVTIAEAVLSINTSTSPSIAKRRLASWLVRRAASFACQPPVGGSRR